MSASGCSTCQPGSSSNALQAYQQAAQSQRSNDTQQATKAQEVQQQIAQQANSVPPSAQNRPILGAAVGGVINISA